MRPDLEGAVRPAFLEIAQTAAEVVAGPAVAAAWSEPSGLRRFTVGGVASHMYLAIRRVRFRLEEEPAPSGLQPMAVGRYYAPSMRVDSDEDLDAPHHVTIRTDGEHVAASAHAVVARSLAELVDRLRPVVATASDERLLTMGDERVFTFADFLATRIVETVVHLDDIAWSCGVDVAMSSEVTAIALDVLFDVPRQRFGDLAMIRALARQERSMPDVLRAL